ncbi:hypothetical protein WJX81_008170 [Elliptochloris bilobata]|uniref:EF-hand domain-containing protein n=1 Tax=Elliptochloris bilobata TaxID=381761 RepID=A0AAW1RV62_9CHLO
MEKPAPQRRFKRSRKKPDLAELSERSAAMRERLHVPFHSLAGSVDEGDAPMNLLEQAETELSEYCESLPDAAASDRCWQAFKFFESKKREAEGSCSLEESSGVAGGSGCMSLERLEAFVRQMVHQAPTRLFVQTLLVLDGAERNSAQAKARMTSKVAAAAEAADRAVDPEVARRERLTALFYALDTDLSGTLDIGEFRDAMRRFGEEMDGRAVGKVLDALDIHGPITLEQFLTIAEAEELVAKTQLATWLRSHTHIDELPKHLDSLL